MKRDLSVVARSAKVGPLDEAIDRVAAAFTRVNDDPALASRILDALPARTNRLGWLAHAWAPRLAVLALAVATAVIVQRSFGDGSTKVLRTEGARAPTVELAPALTAQVTGTPIVERTSNVRRTIVEPPSDDRRAIPDHEFSLAPLQALEALGMASMAPQALTPEESLVVPPLAISDLPSMDESRFPR